MPGYPKPAHQWLGNQLAAVKAQAAANTAGGTEYTVEYPPRKAGDKRPEHERGVSMVISGSDLSHDHAGNATGLTGAGVAVYNTETKKWDRVK